MNARILARAAAATAVSLGLALSAMPGAQASATSKTAGCRPAAVGTSRAVSATATATPYADRWITRRVSVSGTKRQMVGSWNYILVSIAESGYPTTKFPAGGWEGGNRVTRNMNSTPRTITVTWERDLLMPFTTQRVSCTMKAF